MDKGANCSGKKHGDGTKKRERFCHVGMALCDQKKYAEAIPPLEKSLGLDPASGWETRWSLAESDYRGERFDEP